MSENHIFVFLLVRKNCWPFIWCFVLREEGCYQRYDESLWQIVLMAMLAFSSCVNKKGLLNLEKFGSTCDFSVSIKSLSYPKETVDLNEGTLSNLFTWSLKLNERFSFPFEMETYWFVKFQRSCLVSVKYLPFLILQFPPLT